MSSKSRRSLPVQGGLGGASANAVATLLALERALKKPISAPAERLRIAAEVGSDLPLFLVGGTVLGSRPWRRSVSLADLPADRYAWWRRLRSASPLRKHSPIGMHATATRREPWPGPQIDAACSLR